MHIVLALSLSWCIAISLLTGFLGIWKGIDSISIILFGTLSIIAGVISTVILASLLPK